MFLYIFTICLLRGGIFPFFDKEWLDFLPDGSWDGFWFWLVRKVARRCEDKWDVNISCWQHIASNGRRNTAGNIIHLHSEQEQSQPGTPASSSLCLENLSGGNTTPSPPALLITTYQPRLINQPATIHFHTSRCPQVSIFSFLSLNSEKQEFWPFLFVFFAKFWHFVHFSQIFFPFRIQNF